MAYDEPIACPTCPHRISAEWKGYFCMKLFRRNRLVLVSACLCVSGILPLAAQAPQQQPQVPPAKPQQGHPQTPAPQPPPTAPPPTPPPRKTHSRQPPNPPPSRPRPPPQPPRNTSRSSRLARSSR